MIQVLKRKSQLTSTDSLNLFQLVPLDLAWQKKISCNKSYAFQQAKQVDFLV